VLDVVVLIGVVCHEVTSLSRVKETQ